MMRPILNEINGIAMRRKMFFIERRGKWIFGSSLATMYSLPYIVS